MRRRAVFYIRGALNVRPMYNTTISLVIFVIWKAHYERPRLLRPYALLPAKKGEIMKRIAVLFLLLLPLMMSACVVIHVPGDAPASSPAAPSSGNPPRLWSRRPTPAYVSPAPPTFTPALSFAPRGYEYSASGPALYSSYAHMTAYHPASGMADFDYFDMLRGDDAVKWMLKKRLFRGRGGSNRGGFRGFPSLLRKTRIRRYAASISTA
jgi:hypothetical protein